MEHTLVWMGFYIPRPLSIALLYGRTFRKCMKYTGGRHIISCLLSGITIGLSLWPWFIPHNKIFPIGQILLRVTAFYFNCPVNDPNLITDNMEVLLGGVSGLF